MYTHYFRQIVCTQSCTYSFSTNEVLTVYTNTGVKDFCRDNNLDLEDYNYKTVIDTSVADCSFLLENCESFNRPLEFPSTLINCSGALKGCSSFNQKITVPPNAVEKDNLFEGCISLELCNINPSNPIVYSITQFDETRFYKSDLRTLAELINIYLSAERKYGTLMEVNGATQIDEGYFAELQQKQGSESCEFNLDRNVITVITKADFLKVIRNANSLIAEQILELIY